MSFGESSGCFERSPVPNLGASSNQHFKLVALNNVFSIGAFCETSHYKITRENKTPPYPLLEKVEQNRLKKIAF